MKEKQWHQGFHIFGGSTSHLSVTERPTQGSAMAPQRTKRGEGPTAVSSSPNVHNRSNEDTAALLDSKIFFLPSSKVAAGRV
jgi:hypothetical protein